MSSWPSPPPEGPPDRPPDIPPPPPASAGWVGAPGWAGPPGYGQPPGPPPVTGGTNQLCLISMIVGIASIAGAGCCLVFGIPLAIGGVVMGIIGLVQVNEQPGQEGRPMAIAGIVCGAVGAVLPVILFLTQFGLAFSGRFG